MAPEIRDHIFISYYRGDARGASDRLYDWLGIAFGREHEFRDVHSIGIDKWCDKTHRALACGELLLVPTLVEGAELPNTAELPAGLRAIFDDWNAHPITEADWEGGTRPWSNTSQKSPAIGLDNCRHVIYIKTYSAIYLSARRLPPLRTIPTNSRSQKKRPHPKCRRPLHILSSTR